MRKKYKFVFYKFQEISIDFFHIQKMPIYKYIRKYSLSFYINNAIINSTKANELATSTVFFACWFGSYQPQKLKSLSEE